MKRSRFASRILIPFLLLITATLFAGCSGEKKQEELKAGAWQFMVQQVTTRLGNPKGLTFPPDGVSNVTPIGDNRFQITSFADYTNEQGQQENAYFHGTVLYQGETWTLESLKFAE